MQTQTFSLHQLAVLFTLCAVALTTAGVLGAWTGPTATAPGGNVPSPINVGSVSDREALQTKNDQLSVYGLAADALAVFGNAILSGSSPRYINFDTIAGSAGYGIRDNGGTIEIKHNGGSWAKPHHYDPLSAAPSTCNASADGDTAMTDGYKMCVCKNGTGWVTTSDGYTTCPWDTQTVVVNGSSRNWSGGGYAASCAEYRNPGAGYEYSGATGDGTYTISPSGTPRSVYCDMSSDSGVGWTLVVGISDDLSTRTTSAVTPENLASSSGLGKLSDTEINAITGTEFKLVCGSTTGYFQDCTFDMSAAASAACSKISTTSGGSYSQCTTWVSHYGLNSYQCSPYMIASYVGSGLSGGCYSGSTGKIWAR